MDQVDQVALAERLYELNENGAMFSIDEYFAGDTMEFDINLEYYDIDRIRYSDDQLEAICTMSLEIAERHFEKVRQEPSTAEISDTDLLLYSAWRISQAIKKEEDKHNALLQAEEYASSSDRVSYYGTKIEHIIKVMMIIWKSNSQWDIVI